MTIYFAGTENDAVSGGTVNTSTTYFNTNYSVSALMATRYNAVGNSLSTAIGGNDPTGWWFQAHFAWGSWEYNPPAAVGWSGMIVKDANGYIAAQITGTNTGGRYDYMQGTNYRLQVYNAAGGTSYLDLGPNLLNPGKYVYSLHCYTNENSYAVAEFYINNVLKGQVSIAAASANRGAYTVECRGGWYYGTNASNTYYDWPAGISEMILASESTLDMRVKTYRPTADGTHTTWDGNYDNVNNNDVGIDAVSTQLSNAAETFLHGATLDEGTAIRALVVGAAASENPTGAKAVLNINGNLYQQDFEKSLTQGAASNIAIYEDNPATGLSFTAADFNSLEFGVQHS